MTITSLAGVRAGLLPPVITAKNSAVAPSADNMWSQFYAGGYPVAAAAPTPGLAGAILTSYPGQIPFNNPPLVSGNTYLARFSGSTLTSSAAMPYQWMLVDRIWHNSGFTITSTAAQTINSPQFVRDINNSNLGDGIYLGVEVSATLGAATSIITVGYYNQANVLKFATNIAPMTSASTVGTFYPIGLTNGDTGVRSVANLTLTTSLVSGTIHLVAYRPIAVWDATLETSGFPLRKHRNTVEDAFTFAMPELHANSVPQLMSVHHVSGTATARTATITYTQG